MKKIIFYLTILSFISIQSQEVAFTVGTNYTDYSFDANDDFEATGMGSHFEIGYTKKIGNCLLYTSPSPRDRTRSRMPSSA